MTEACRETKIFTEKYQKDIETDMCTETSRDRHKNAGDIPWMWRGRHVYLKKE